MIGRREREAWAASSFHSGETSPDPGQALSRGVRGSWPTSGDPCTQSRAMDPTWGFRSRIRTVMGQTLVRDAGEGARVTGRAWGPLSEVMVPPAPGPFKCPCSWGPAGPAWYVFQVELLAPPFLAAWPLCLGFLICKLGVMAGMCVSRGSARAAPGIGPPCVSALFVISRHVVQRCPYGPEQTMSQTRLLLDIWAQRARLGLWVRSLTSPCCAVGPTLS